MNVCAELRPQRATRSIGWHGSDFKRWDSGLSDYNSAKMGPRIDVMGGVARAVRRRGLKFLVSYLEVIAPGWGHFAILKVDLPP